MLSFKPTFSLFSFSFIKRLFSSSSLSAIRVMSSAYLSLLIFLLTFFIPAWASSSLAFCMMYSAWKLNKEGDNIQPWCTSFSIWNQSVVPCPVLMVASWLAYKFLKRQVRWSGIPISFRIFHSLLWSTQSKALAQSMKQMFFWNILALSMIQWMLAIWSLVPQPFLNPAWTSESSSFMYLLLKHSLKNFEHYFDSMWNECNCAVVWTLVALPLFGIGMKIDLVYWFLLFSSISLHCSLKKAFLFLLAILWNSAFR